MKIDRCWPVPYVALAFGLSLTGCAIDLPATPPAPQPAPPNYRQLTATYFASTLVKIPVAGSSISSLQPAVTPQPGEWYACLKLTNSDYYAVFYAEGKVAEARNAVEIDRCAAADGYMPLPPPEKPKPATPVTPAKNKNNDTN
jgi:hypothetical protein